MAIIKKPAIVSKADTKPTAKPAIKNVAKPIEVSNPKDKRLSKYTDSLNLYNRGKDIVSYSKKNPNASNSQLNLKEVELEKKYPVSRKSDGFGSDRISSIKSEIVSKGKAQRAAPQYKKPTQPIIYKKPTTKPIENKVAKVENKVIKADTTQTKPRVKKAGERIVADNRSGNGYPNVDNVYINNKLDSIQNQAGERLKYGTKFTKEWQYKNTGKKKK
jgi:hypothetical protein